MKKVNVGQKGWSLPGMQNASPLSAKTFTSPSSLGFPVTQGLADAGHDWDFIRGEIFCQMKPVLTGCGEEWRERLCRSGSQRGTPSKASLIFLQSRSDRVRPCL